MGSETPQSLEAGDVRRDQPRALRESSREMGRELEGDGIPQPQGMQRVRDRPKSHDGQGTNV